MHTRALLVAAVIAGCGGSDGSGDENQLSNDCSQANAACGNVSLRWTIDRAGVDSTCAGVGAVKVALTTKFQADGRTAKFEAACSNGALLTLAIPVGPYALDAQLEDGAGAILDVRSTTLTLGVSNTVTEAVLDFDVVPTIAPGRSFGRCSPAMPCQSGSEHCAMVDASSGYCSPSCTQPQNDPACASAYSPFINGAETDLRCAPLAQAQPASCIVLCGGMLRACASGLTCRELVPFGPVCVP